MLILCLLTSAQVTSLIAVHILLLMKALSKSQLDAIMTCGSYWNNPGCYLVHNPNVSLSYHSHSESSLSQFFRYLFFNIVTYIYNQI